MKIEPLGDSALLVRVLDEFDPDTAPEAVRIALQQLEAAALPGVVELAPGYSTIGVFVDPARSEIFPELRTRIERALRDERKVTRDRPPPAIEVPVCYDPEFGPDLDEVARHAGLGPEEVVRRHAGASYLVNCVGFTPGFPYLSGLPGELATPRRASPRKEVPAGAVAIGGRQTGIYPRKSPGGWNIIGRTPLRLFDVERNPPAMFHAGDRVRFRTISREEFEQMSQ